ncbi:complex I NDUFA9 subunit family protein [Amantichitinum ursilacus]|uniref:NAD(P)H azoreductase n=1 Tax=Amantichitinum ursilacus TaxID=857265 RepID=A0A0N0GQ20_9NEIS|nr:complex I NDUFA9 subunit family protein [Amantichitinum ursilacus]KPC54023.1 NAD(P)H azoreductase [Amantichitinum ursilacus]
MSASSQRLPVLMLGGSGFVGTYLAAQLCRAGFRVIVPTRDRERMRGRLLTLPNVTLVQADIHDRSVLPQLVLGCSAVINLVGILQGTPRAFARNHYELTCDVLEACRATGVTRYLHMSALGASADGPSHYLRSKGQAEDTVRASHEQWTIFRPSVIFGEGDSFLTLFAALQKRFPVMPLARADAQFQPVWVKDVAAAFVQALLDPAYIGKTIDLAGPRVYTLSDIVRYVGVISGNPRPVWALPDWAGRLQATVLGLLPNAPMSIDNFDSMSVANTSTQPFPPIAGQPPSALEAIAPAYLSVAATRGRFAGHRARARRGNLSP